MSVLVTFMLLWQDYQKQLKGVRAHWGSQFQGFPSIMAGDPAEEPVTEAVHTASGEKAEGG